MIDKHLCTELGNCEKRRLVEKIQLFITPTNLYKIKHIYVEY